MDNSCSLENDCVVSLCNAKRHMKEIYCGVCVIPLSYFTFLHHNTLVDKKVAGSLMTAGGTCTKKVRSVNGQLGTHWSDNNIGYAPILPKWVDQVSDIGADPCGRSTFQFCLLIIIMSTGMLHVLLTHDAAHAACW